ncbi:5415_t:CDS:1, partial [Racocetra persica]
ANNDVSRMEITGNIVITKELPPEAFWVVDESATDLDVCLSGFSDGADEVDEAGVVDVALGALVELLLSTTKLRLPPSST